MCFDAYRQCYIEICHLFFHTRYIPPNTAPSCTYNFLHHHQTHMWNGFVGGAEGRGTKKRRGGVRERDWEYKTKPKTFGNISPFRCINRTSTDFWYMYCARRNVGILINAGAKKAFEHFNVILINLCLSVYGHRSSSFLERCGYIDRWVSVYVLMYSWYNLLII